ncbi:MAG: hypothetical protein LUG26_01850 [Ruminococcus sp.]|nr:hypothetical protein [Ruminococcus sp.]
MKRLITFAAAIVMAVCLCACSSVGGGDSTMPNGLGNRFQAAVSVTIDELDAEGTLKRFGDGMWEVEFSSPNTLSGVMLSFSEGSVTASYNGLKFSVPQSALPVKAMMLNLISAVDDLAKNQELTGTEEDGMLKISGTLEGGEYTLCVDGDGNIASFEMPNNKVEIIFSGVTEIAGDSSESESESETTAEVTQEEASAEESSEAASEAA